MEKRKVLVMLATMIMGAMLIGCGSSKKNSSDESKKTQTKESQTNESESKEIESKTEENVDTSDKKETEDSSENETQKSDSKETANTTSNSGIYDELAAIEQQEKEIIERVNRDDVTQMEMTQAASDRYKLWDDELNSIWGRLEEKLSSSEMEKLRAAQRTWIADKESAVEIAGKEVEGGSMQPMVEADTAAELTKERVYKLADMLE